MWDMITAYSVFAEQGDRIEPYMVERIVDRNGRVLEEHETQRENVISPQTAFLMTNIMQAVIEEGTGRRARKLGRPAAGKTGTSNDIKDAWFLGYTPSIMTGVWLGYDDVDVSLGSGETGGHAACPVWLYFMEDYLQGTPLEQFTVPPDIVFARVRAQSASSAEEPENVKTVSVAFRKDQLPRTRDPLSERKEVASDGDEALDPSSDSGGSRSAPKTEDSTASFFKSDLF
jgi:penicillin-binding protein 1A